MQPAQPVSSDQHIPEFITNKPNPQTGVPVDDGDGDVHDTVFTVSDRHVGAAQHDGDMGRLSKV